MSETRDLRGEDVFDSRDVIARIEELETEIADAAEMEEEPDADAAEELVALIALRDEASGSPDWRYGETLIADSYFEEYAQQMAEDIGAIDRNASWPLTHIDWTAAADALKQDYMSVEFDGVEYWIRA